MPAGLLRVKGPTALIQSRYECRGRWKDYFRRSREESPDSPEEQPAVTTITEQQKMLKYRNLNCYVLQINMQVWPLPSIQKHNN
jgi:hypothetical protein